MKRSKTSSRGLRSGDRRPFARLSAQVRRRATVLRLESLEERTLLSTTKGPLPQGPSLPVGLGTTYTVLSEQAHGVSTSTKPSNQFVPGSGSTSTSSTFTMADFNAYLKQLKLSLDQVTGQGAQGPGSVKAQKPAPGPNTYYSDNQDNPQQESQPVFSVNDPAALLARLKLDPNSSGYSTPEVNPALDHWL